MFEATMHNGLDHAIDALIANPDSKPAGADSAPETTVARGEAAE